MAVIHLPQGVRQKLSLFTQLEPRRQTPLAVACLPSGMTNLLPAPAGERNHPRSGFHTFSKPKDWKSFTFAVANLVTPW